MDRQHAIKEIENIQVKEYRKVFKRGDTGYNGRLTTPSNRIHSHAVTSYTYVL